MDAEQRCRTICAHVCARTVNRAGVIGAGRASDEPYVCLGLLARSAPELAVFWGRHLSAPAGRTLPVHRLLSACLINVLTRELWPCSHWGTGLSRIFRDLRLPLRSYLPVCPQ